MDADSPTTKRFGTLLSLYMMTVMGMGAYYNWQYAREHGFIEWLLLGEIAPSAKALVWPYFVFGTNRTSQTPLTSQAPPRTPEERDRNRLLAQQDHDREAISKFNSVMRTFTEFIGFSIQYNGVPRGKVPQSVWDRMKAYQDEMLKEGSEIDIEVLNAAYPELGNHFRDQFLRGLSLAVEFENVGIEIRKNGGQPPPLTPELLAKYGAAIELSKQWGDYYDGNYQEAVAALKRKWGQ